MPYCEATKMILSTVNLVNNYKFSDFIIKKITEEQSERDTEVVKKTKRHSFGAVTRRVSLYLDIFPELFITGCNMFCYSKELVLFFSFACLCVR